MKFFLLMAWSLIGCVSQLYDKGYKVLFYKDLYTMLDTNGDITIFVGNKQNNIYTLSFNDLIAQNIKCLSMNDDDIYLWHWWLGYVSMDLLNDLSKTWTS